MGMEGEKQISLILSPILSHSEFSPCYFHELSLSGTTMELKAKFVCMISYMCESYLRTKQRIFHFFSEDALCMAYHHNPAGQHNFFQQPVLKRKWKFKFLYSYDFYSACAQRENEEGRRMGKGGSSLVKDPCRSCLHCCCYSGRCDEEFRTFLLQNFFLNFSQKSILNFVPTK